MDLKPYNEALRRASILLLISVLINCLFVGYFILELFYFPFEGSLEKISFLDKKPSQISLSSSLSTVIRAMRALSLDELIQKTNDARVIEDGITVRDVALSILNDRFFLDVERALARPLIRKNLFLQDEKEPFSLIQEIPELDFQLIAQFIQKEKWPFTPEGLFRLLKREKYRDNLSLKEAFYHTEPFLRLERLFARANPPPSKEELLNLLLGVDFKEILALTYTSDGVVDLSDSLRREFLLSQVQKKSAAAALILYRTDMEFSLRKLDNRTAVILLQLLPEKEKIAYAKALSKMPRSETVIQEASKHIATGTPVIPKTALPIQKNLSSAPKKKESKPRPSSTCVSPKRVYVITENDSLWKIANRFSVSIEALRKENRLTSDRLKPGSTLIIPQK